MLLATIWRSLRWRLLAAILLVAAPVSLVAWAYDAPSNGVVYGGTYMRYVDETWFHLPGGSGIFLLVAVIVSASGRLMRPGGDLAYTLALPISRRRWMLAHAGGSVAAIAVVHLLVDVALVAGAVRVHQPVDAIGLLARTLAVVVAASVWVGVTIGALGLVRYPVLAVTLVLGVLSRTPGGWFRLEMPAKPTSQRLVAWDPWALADPRAWQGEVPLASLALALALGIGGLAVGLYRLERLEP